MVAKILHDLHTTQFAWRTRRLRHRQYAQGIGAAQQTALRTAEPFRASNIQEQWMKLAKTFAVAFAVSALFAGSALAQGMSTQSQTGAGMQGRSPGTMQGAPSGAGAADEELNARTGARDREGRRRCQERHPGHSRCRHQWTQGDRFRGCGAGNQEVLKHDPKVFSGLSKRSCLSTKLKRDDDSSESHHVLAHDHRMQRALRALHPVAPFTRRSRGRRDAP
ncbi:hypothetical protein [Bradyrhizobium sp. ISRA463]|uniref:hypothetical protein n=1 Tax=Bradyrhizobium sp. ISRA463 TaxID=2866199 RepID=UPI002479B2D3|nr:hypothetical protein [Bradyrhizobium sp. ISRA463]WGS21926.1 hypothetical protein MTX22_09655 [Bradyrhizobium sp. ISRA463]